MANITSYRAAIIMPCSYTQQTTTTYSELQGVVTY